MVRVFSRDDGTTVIEDLDASIVASDRGPRTSQPTTSISFLRGDTETVVRNRYRLPDDVPSYHNAPNRVYVFVMAGSLNLEVASGDRRTLVPGDVALLEDMTGEGHISRGRADLATVMLAESSQSP
jgi:hypothetical protein